MTTIVVSDVHLGTKSSRCAALLQLLQNIEWDRLIILGDLFEDANFNRFKKKGWQLLSYLRKQTSKKRNRQVIWLEGNHDKLIINVMGPILGVQVIPDQTCLTLKIGKKRYLFHHGHRFDDYIMKNPVKSMIASSAYALLQELDSKDQKACRYLKQRSKDFLRVREAIARRASEHAAKKGADVVMCGHVHYAEEIVFDDLGVTYVNTGCATDVPAHYVRIDKQGHQLLQY